MFMFIELGSSGLVRIEGHKFLKLKEVVVEIDASNLIKKCISQSSRCIMRGSRCRDIRHS